MIGARLQRHQNELLIDIEALDRLYTANLAHVHELESYIEAGDDAVAEANRELIGTIEDSLRIAEEGRRVRSTAALELRVMEDALRQSLVAVTSRQP